MAIVPTLLLLPVVLFLLLRGVRSKIWRRGRRRELFVVILILLLESMCVGLSYRQMHEFDGVEMYPRVSAKEMAGRWTYEGSYVDLREDGTVNDSDGSRGNWSISAGDFSTTGQNADGSERTWVVIRRYGVLGLLRVNDWAGESFTPADRPLLKESK